MVKVVTFLSRKAGMSVDEFQAYWRTRHPEVVTRLPGIHRYVQSHALPAMYARGEPVYDGIAEVWAEDTDAVRAMSRSPLYAELVADEERFIDRTRMGFIVTEEEVVIDGAVALDAVKAVEPLTRQPGLTVETFQAHWRGPHAALAARLPGLRRYAISATRPAAYGAGRVPAYDGAALLWFDSLDALAAVGASAEYRALVADRAGFLAPGAPPFLVTREHVIIG